MYQKVSTDMNFKDREGKVLDFWKENHTFEESLAIRKDAPVFTFYDGPPTANGKPHMGHVLTRVIKDMIPRYRTMKGYYVPRKAGWDTHGLPVELEIEKQLGLNGKEQIEQYGLAPFIQKCKESVWKYKGMWEEFSGKVGFWADMNNPYVTYHDDFIESEWWALKNVYDRGLLYKGYKVVPYCPRCGTPLSSHEVAQGYKDVKERSAIVRFKMKDSDVYILAWTTTPWTLPSNVGLCVNPESTYATVKAADGYTYLMAEALLDTVLGKLATEDQPAYEVLSTCKGKELEYKEYEPLYDFQVPIVEKQHKKAHFICCDDYVTLTDGTGVVHQAPAFGEDDARVGRKYDLAFVQLVDEKGEMTKETPWEGVFVKKADPLVLKDLEERGLLFDAPKFEHSYPHCWRCDTPLIYYARESWFIKMTEVKENLIRNNKKINWIPETIGSGRFGDWLENIQDWGISRNRYWGTPLNIWECDACGERQAIGSRAELREKALNWPAEGEVLGSPYVDEHSTATTEADRRVELHRPYIDEIKVKCPCCGGEMKRVPEVIDCWFDSGAMPYAQHHYPFENENLFRQQFPAKFISEAVDQTRGWFYSLLAESTLLFDAPSYENVIVLGLVLDEDGQKMSKSKGNAVDPMEVLNQYGADAIRWYFYVNSAPWLPNRFGDKGIQEAQRKFLRPLWNTYAFYVLYAEIDQFDPTKYTLNKEDLTVMDRWILSKLNTVVGEVDKDLENYMIPEAARALQSFVDDLSNWYVRRGRERFWAKGMEADKVAAYMTLYTSLVTLAKAAAPMIPFMTEDIYRNLVVSVDPSAPSSVHLCDFPTVDESLIDKDLEASMDEVLSITTLGRACRNLSNIKNRQPLSKMVVQLEEGETELADYFKEIIEDELNVKTVEFTTDASAFVNYSFKPQMRTLGPKYGKLLGKIREKLISIEDGREAYRTLEAGGTLNFEIDGTAVELTKDDVLIEMTQLSNYVAQSEGARTVALNTELTPELLEEGYVNEVTSKLQTMRKEAGFEVTDHILLYVDKAATDSELAALIEKNADSIFATVLCDGSLDSADDTCYTKEWDINGKNATFGVKKA